MDIPKEIFIDCVEKMREYYEWIGEFCDILNMGEIPPMLDQLGGVMAALILNDSSYKDYDDFWNVLILSDEVEKEEIENFYERIFN